MGREKEAGLVTKAISTGNAKHRQWQLLGIEDGIQPAIVFPSGGAGAAVGHRTFPLVGRRTLKSMPNPRDFERL